MKRRLCLLSSNGCLAVCSVVELTGYDHGVQHVASGLGAFAETGADDFDRNLGDLGGSGGGTVIGVLDSDEIDGAITTLEYIKAHKSVMKNYTEITYTDSSGLELGAYKGARESYIFIKFSSRDTE